MSKMITKDELAAANAQYGHQTKIWNPKMKPYIYGVKNKTHIIDLEKTIKSLEEVKKFVVELGKQKQKMIFVGTKLNSAEAVKECAIRTQNYYVDLRWLGGTLTNMKTIMSRVKVLWSIENDEKSGKLSLLPKKEQIKKRKERNKLEKTLGGIKFMNSLPSCIYIVDPKHNEIVVKEANKLKIPVIAICDTNVNPENIDYVIPANDDVVESINLITNFIAECYAEGAQMKIAPSHLKMVVTKKEDKHFYTKKNKVEATENIESKTTIKEPNKKIIKIKQNEAGVEKKVKEEKK